VDSCLSIFCGNGQTTWVAHLTAAHYTVAVDGSDCHVIWTSKWSPRDYETMNMQRGAALAGGKIIRGTADGFLLALNAKDGHTLWAKQIANSKEGYFISMPPLVHGDLAYIGPAGAEWAAKGWVGAFRASYGEPAQTRGGRSGSVQTRRRKSLDSDDL